MNGLNRTPWMETHVTRHAAWRVTSFRHLQLPMMLISAVIVTTFDLWTNGVSAPPNPSVLATGGTLAHPTRAPPPAAAPPMACLAAAAVLAAAVPALAVAVLEADDAEPGCWDAEPALEEPLGGEAAGGGCLGCADRRLVRRRAQLAGQNR